MIETARLSLIVPTDTQLEADLVSRLELAAALGVVVPETWPPEFYDADAIRWILDHRKQPNHRPQWGFFYFVLREPAVLVGAGGFKGQPANGVVELGYGIASEYRRRGLASEAVLGMLTHAFASPEVREVCAETLPELISSIGVVEKCNFTFTGPGSEEGVIRYAISRSDYESQSCAPPCRELA